MFSMQVCTVKYLVWLFVCVWLFDVNNRGAHDSEWLSLKSSTVMGYLFSVCIFLWVVFGVVLLVFSRRGAAGDDQIPA